MKILVKKISILYSLLLLLLTIFVTYTYTIKAEEQKFAERTYDISEENGSKYVVKRLEGLKFTKPLMFADEAFESEKLNSVKQSINSIIESHKMKGDLKTASVYLKEYKDNIWMQINGNELYQPASLLKIPELITFLKMNERHPGLLDKKIAFDHLFESDKHPIFTSKSIQLGHTYTVRELLNYMISYSDNNATLLLNANIDIDQFKRVFTDFGLKAPDWNAGTYPIDVFDISLFMRGLYNVSYLTIDDSEFAIQLLTKSDFKEGIESGLPSKITLAHKFGEGGNDVEKQLHESAIVYLKGNAYVLTVMTKGSDLKQLTKILSEISASAYQQMINI